MKTAVVCFFDAYPARTGSGRVCYDFFQSWPCSNKKLFQMSEFDLSQNYIEDIKLIYNKPIFKIFCLPRLIFILIKYFKNSKDNVLILEGASWIFYSFILVFFFKFIYKKIIILYRSHSIELEIRKNNSNFFIVLITKFCEKFVYKFSNISTSVSTIEKKKLFNYYNIETFTFPNSIRISDLVTLRQKRILKLPKNFILFCGSYKYAPNKQAIDYIIKNILPNSDIALKGISLVLTGDTNLKLNNTKKQSKRAALLSNLIFKFQLSFGAHYLHANKS